MADTKKDTEKPAAISKAPLGAVSRVLSVRDYRGHMVNRKAWEIARSIEALQEHGAIHKDATILGVGAGVEPTGFAISKHVKWVFMTDIYANAGSWIGAAPPAMLLDPGKLNEDGDARRIIPLHMDGRSLRFPDDTFDGIFSAGSIEHFGTWEDIAQAAKEIGRVLKPGGVASLQTEFMFAGDGDHFHNVYLFTPDRIQEYIVKPSKLELITDDNVPFSVDEATQLSVWKLDDIVIRGNWPPVEGALSSHGFNFTSVHLVLKKPE